jgi:hypothetical protein
MAFVADARAGRVNLRDRADAELHQDILWGVLAVDHAALI